MISGADILAQGLQILGVDVVFGVSGGDSLPLWRALEESPIRAVAAGSERAATHAADGYARASGRLGVVVTATGPAAAGAVGAAGEAWASGSPVVVISTEVPLGLRREGVYRGAPHECRDQGALFGPVVKALALADGMESLLTLELAAGTAAVMAPSGPVYLGVPADLLTATVEEAQGEHATPEYAEPDEADVEAAAELLSRARRPLLWVGGGALRAGAGAEVGELAERLAAPVLLTHSARGLLAPDHPCLVGLPPHVPEAGALWDEADVVVSIGSDLDGPMTQNWAMPEPPEMVIINIDPADGGKNYAADEVLAGTARAATAALAQTVPGRRGLEGLRERLSALRAAAWARLGAEHPQEVGFLRAVGSVLPDDAVLVVDPGPPGDWLAALHPVAGPRRLLCPAGWGASGFAFPAAVGAALAGGGPAVGVCAAGAFVDACGELSTAAREGLALTAVVVGDGEAGAPDLVSLAGSFGVHAEAVAGLGQALGAALARHLSRPGPSVLVASGALADAPTAAGRWYRAAG